MGPKKSSIQSWLPENHFRHMKLIEQNDFKFKNGLIDISIMIDIQKILRFFIGKNAVII